MYVIMYNIACKQYIYSAGCVLKIIYFLQHKHNHFSKTTYLVGDN